MHLHCAIGVKSEGRVYARPRLTIVTRHASAVARPPPWRANARRTSRRHASHTACHRLKATPRPPPRSRSSSSSRSFCARSAQTTECRRQNPPRPHRRFQIARAGNFSTLPSHSPSKPKPEPKTTPPGFLGFPSRPRRRHHRPAADHLPGYSSPNEPPGSTTVEPSRAGLFPVFAAALPRAASLAAFFPVCFIRVNHFQKRN